MEKRTSALARLAAALALVVAVLVLVVVVSAAMNDDSSSRDQRTEQPAKKQKKQRTKAKTYTVQSGDTLTAISHKTGVPVAEILALNPEVDPQILIAGETLKLR
ncbi:MAG: LysM peptidoglycan-binding domain-containing protein [Actinomycetota bacterium]|nr:LysM peptidoglycan-binding domain-containing protein [Actinomycetota bacterium]